MKKDIESKKQRDKCENYSKTYCEKTIREISGSSVNRAKPKIIDMQIIKQSNKRKERSPPQETPRKNKKIVAQTLKKSTCKINTKVKRKG